MHAFSIDGDEKRRGSLRERLPLLLIVFLTFLLPIFFIPGSIFDFSISKQVLLSLCVIISFCLVVFQRLKEGVLVFPKAYLFAAVPLLLLVFIASALFSGSFAPTFIGQGMEVGTVSFMAIMTLLFLTVATTLRSKEYIFYLYVALLAAFSILALHTLIRLFFGPGALSFGIFTSNTANFLGTWNDLGIFFGLSAILSLTTLEFLPLSRLLRWVFSVALALSLFLLGVVNFSTVWIVLGVFSVILFVYAMSFGRVQRGHGDGSDHETLSAKRLPVPTIVVLAVSAMFLFASGSLSSAVSSIFHISYLEARPSWSSTLSIAKSTLSAEPLLGAGPNRFGNKWLLFKPAGINTTPFWNIDFSAGIGLLPTFVVTTGIVGAVAWVFFLCSFLYLGFRALPPREDRFAYYLTLSSFIAALYLWVLCVFYVPNAVIFTFAFLFTGLFLAMCTSERLIPEKRISFADNPRSSFIASLALIVVLIGSVAGGYFSIQKFVASTYFARGVLAFQGGSADNARAFTEKAIGLSPNDLYYRFLSQVHLQRLGELLGKKDVSADTARTQFQEILGAAIVNARSAVDFDASNYQNWVALGSVYGAVIPLNINGAYDSAKAAYQEAIARNPENPSLYLSLARFEAARKNMEAARGFIGDALKKKNNYTEAIFFLSQIQVSQGDLPAAINSVETASLIAPDDPTVFFQLGLLRYNNQDFSGTISALERAVLLNPSYSNARYFLGLSYDRVGRKNDAINQFVEIEKFNPDNQEVKTILVNLRAGRAALANAATIADTKPQDRKELPIKGE